MSDRAESCAGHLKSQLQQKLKGLKLIERKYCQHGKYNKQTDPMIL